MPADASLQNFGFVYGRIGTARGTTTSSAVFAFDTGFARTVKFALAVDGGFAGRNNALDPSLTTGLGTYVVFQKITPNGAQARFRAWQANKKTAGGSAATSTWASALTGVRAEWIAFGY